MIKMKNFKTLIFSLLIVLSFNTVFSQNEFDELAQTPPMGWNSWNTFRCDVNEKLIKEMADAIVENGLDKAGYEYVVIDDCWQVERDKNGIIQADPERFPSGMKALADYVHSKGLKFGIYSCAGNKTCQGRPGSRGYEFVDAKTYAEWGVDYLKYDWCYHGEQKAKAAFKTMSDALRAQDRPIVFSICEWGTNDPWKWGKEIGHLWRMSGDIRPCFDCTGDVATSGFMVIADMMSEKNLRYFGGPGGWNDLDMLEVGNPGLSVDESKSHFGLWAMFASPLMLGNDLRNLNPQTLEIISNKEVIAINQDPDGKIGWKYRDYGDTEIYRKNLAPEKDGTHNDAFLLLNRSNEVKEITLYLDEHDNIRDLWEHKDLGEMKTGEFTVKLKPHASTMIKVTGLKFWN